jgi:hypothetical protein
MNEADLLYHLSEAINRMWTLMQWWASISFGLLLVAHFAADKLNKYLMIFLSLLYIGFTAVIIQILAKNYGVAEAVYVDLAKIAESSDTISATSRFWLENRKSSFQFLLPVTLSGTFLGVWGYLIYCFRKQRI